MRRRARNQLGLDLGRDGRTDRPTHAPEGLVQALADLLLEAFREQNGAIEAAREACDAAKDHA
jgi:hypothetical protein